MTDPQWVEIFDLLREEDCLSPTSISGHMSALKFATEKVYREPMRRIEGLYLPKRVDNIRIEPHAEEVRAIVERMRGIPRVVIFVIIGSGMRIEETCQLRVHQLDLIGTMAGVRRGKGDKDRFTRVDQSLVPHLQRYVEWRRGLWNDDLESAGWGVELPCALARKYRNAPREWEWQWLFPSSRLHRDSGRWYVSPRSVQRAMKEARQAAGVSRIITPHHLRHFHAAELKRRGVDMADIQTLLGHADIETTRRYTHSDDIRRMVLPDVISGLFANQLPTSA